MFAQTRQVSGCWNSGAQYALDATPPVIADENGLVQRRMASVDPECRSFYLESDVCRICISIGDSDWTELWSADETGELERTFAVDDFLDVNPSAARYECYVKYE